MNKFDRTLLTVLLSLASSVSWAADKPDSTSICNPFSDGRIFYISRSSGCDTNDGMSESTPFQTLEPLSTVELRPGDKIFLRAGDTWAGQSFRPKGSGTAENPIEISSYGTGDRPVIKATLSSVYGIQLVNVAGYRITGLEFCGGFAGVSTLYEDSYDNSFLWIEDCSFHDITNHTHAIPPGHFDLVYGAGINIYGMDGIGGRNLLSDITITGCRFDKCDAGIQILGADDDKTRHRKNKISHDAFRNVNISDCDVRRSYRSGGVMLYCINGGSARRVVVDQTGYNGVGMWWGVCAFQCTRVRNFVVEQCTFSNTIRGSSPDGQGFDFEADNRDITVRNCRFIDNEGPAILWYGDSWPGENIGCVVEDCYFEGNNFVSDTSYDYYNRVFAVGKPGNSGIIRRCEIHLRNVSQDFDPAPIIFDGSNRVYAPGGALLYPQGGTAAGNPGAEANSTTK